MTTLVRWEPFRDIAQLQGEMSRLFDGLLDTGGRSAQTWVPPLDVWETGTEIVYAFDLPGLAEDEISIEVHDDTLTVSGERRRRPRSRTTGSSASSAGTGASRAQSGYRRRRRGRDLGLVPEWSARGPCPGSRRRRSRAHPTRIGARRRRGDRLGDDDSWSTSNDRGRPPGPPSALESAPCLASRMPSTSRSRTNSARRSSTSQSPSTTTRRRCRTARRPLLPPGGRGAEPRDDDGRVPPRRLRAGRDPRRRGAAGDLRRRRRPGAARARPGEARHGADQELALTARGRATSSRSSSCTGSCRSSAKRSRRCRRCSTSSHARRTAWMQVEDFLARESGGENPLDAQAPAGGGGAL